MVYGEWEGSTKNIQPFFTATYSAFETRPLLELNLSDTVKFVFVGTLSSGKNPLYAIQLIEILYKKGYKVSLDIYGEGVERSVLKHYLHSNGLGHCIALLGNQKSDTLKKAYQNSHFVLLPSESEGWPKAIAEGMFWGCVPIATPVSCVPFMLGYGDRGVLLEKQLEKDIGQIVALLKDEKIFFYKREKAALWSRKYTLDVFEKEIKKILIP